MDITITNGTSVVKRPVGERPGINCVHKIKVTKEEERAAQQVDEVNVLEDQQLQGSRYLRPLFFLVFCARKNQRLKKSNARATHDETAPTSS